MAEKFDCGVGKSLAILFSYFFARLEPEQLFVVSHRP
jgi:hypothetical protein